MESSGCARAGARTAKGGGQMPQDRLRQAIFTELQQAIGEPGWVSGGCARDTLRALQEVFKMGDEHTLRAATAMSGIALRGDTCGAVAGAIMALGLAMGGAHRDDEAEARHAIGAARWLCRHFEQEFGSCNCRDVQHRIFGRSFNLADPADREAFAEANADVRCLAPVQAAARLAAEVILEHREKLHHSH